MSTCDTCKHWMGNGTAYIAPCGLYGNNVACNHTCASHTPHTPEKPEAMRQYPPTTQAVVGMCGAFICGHCHRIIDASLATCAGCGRLWVVA